MIILGAATLAYDDNEIHLDIQAEQNETINLPCRSGSVCII